MPGGPMPVSNANELEAWIEMLYSGKCIPEAAVLQLCKKVRRLWWIGLARGR